MRDFFISYNGADKSWAEWIAWTLEEAGYSVFLQAWDFRPGSNFVLDMQRAATGAHKVILVLSQSYLNAAYTQPEWAAAFAADPRGASRNLIPVRIARCDVAGLLAAIVYVDLVGLPERDAQLALLGAFSERAKPAAAPLYPGRPAVEPAMKENRVVPTKQTYPGLPGNTVAIADSLAEAMRHAEADDHTPTLSAAERLQLIQKLNATAAQQFNMIVFALNPPPGLVPPMPAPQGDRTFALLSWAESKNGCGVATIQRTLETTVNPN
jgi:hypothetical protein